MIPTAAELSHRRVYGSVRSCRKQGLHASRPLTARPGPDPRDRTATRPYVSSLRNDGSASAQAIHNLPLFPKKHAPSPRNRKDFRLNAGDVRRELPIEPRFAGVAPFDRPIALSASLVEHPCQRHADHGEIVGVIMTPSSSGLWSARSG